MPRCGRLFPENSSASALLRQLPSPGMHGVKAHAVARHGFQGLNHGRLHGAWQRNALQLAACRLPLLAAQGACAMSAPLPFVIPLFIAPNQPRRTMTAAAWPKGDPGYAASPSSRAHGSTGRQPPGLASPCMEKMPASPGPKRDKEKSLLNRSSRGLCWWVIHGSNM